MSNQKEKSPSRVARNFLKRFGKKRFQEFLAGLQRGESNAHWGRELGVSRERARQWEREFTSSMTVVTIHPDVRGLLAESSEIPPT